jgi:LacI family transcriptional regulator
MLTKRPTIVDVARHAGVSKSTVSLVLRSSPLVKSETVVAVRASIDQLGYVYNRSAANLRSSGLGLIGLVINDLRNPFFTEFAATVQKTLAQRGYATIIGDTSEDPALQAQTVLSMIEHGVSGLVISPAYGDTTGCFERVLKAEIPALQVLRKIEHGSNKLPFASFDYGKGGALATRHLVESGCKKIAFVGGVAAREITQERMQGYLSVLNELGRLPLAWHGPTTRLFGREMAIAISREHPDVDGVLCFNDQVALGMLSGFAEIGRDVGPEIRIVGFDDIEECANTWPKLSSVDCNIAGFGVWVAEALLDWLEHGKRLETPYIADVELKVRASSNGEASSR